MEQQNITLLTSSNWDSWRHEVKVLLLHFGAWEFVGEAEESDKPPDNPVISEKPNQNDDIAESEKSPTKTLAKSPSKTVEPAASKSEVEPEARVLTWREKQDLKLRKNRAYTIIYQSLSSEFKPLISSTTDGAKAWRILHDHFEPTTRARVIQLLDVFFSTKYVPGENLGLFLCRVKQAAERLRDVGHQLQSLYVGYQMIRSLPDEYRATVQAIYRWKDVDFVPDRIESELLLEENRLCLSQRDLADVNVAYASESSVKPGGFGTSTPSSTFAFGLHYYPHLQLLPAQRLGGVDIQTSTGLNGVNASNKKDSKGIKESQIPNELAITVESFKKYVKEQKAIREEMSRVSSKNIFRVQEQVNALKQQLSVVSNGLQRNAVAIAKLKEESNCELKNAEIAQRTRDAPASLQYENNAPAEYFENLANNFEKQMQTYRHEIEQLERHLVSLTQPCTLTANEWTAIRRRLHDTFVTLAAQLQTCHQEVQEQCENDSSQRVNITTVVTNLYLEAGNSNKYIQDAFMLLVPVLQACLLESS